MYKLRYKIQNNKGVWQIINKITKRVIIEAYRRAEALSCLHYIDLIASEPDQNNLKSAETS